MDKAAHLGFQPSPLPTPASWASGCTSGCVRALPGDMTAGDSQCRQVSCFSRAPARNAPWFAAVKLAGRDGGVHVGTVWKMGNGGWAGWPSWVNSAGRWCWVQTYRQNAAQRLIELNYLLSNFIYSRQLNIDRRWNLFFCFSAGQGRRQAAAAKVATQLGHSGGEVAQ